MDDRELCRQNPNAEALYRAAEQQCLALKPTLTPDQWQRILAFLAAIAQLIAQIFTPPVSPPVGANGQKG